MVAAGFNHPYAKSGPTQRHVNWRKYGSVAGARLSRLQVFRKSPYGSFHGVTPARPWRVSTTRMVPEVRHGR